jgi:hypothetical protein
MRSWVLFGTVYFVWSVASRATVATAAKKKVANKAHDDDEKHQANEL